MSDRDGDLDAASLLCYAELLRDTIERRLRPTGGTDLVAPSTEGMFDDALRTVMAAMLHDRLAALPPEQFAALYRSVGGDGALLAALDELVAGRRADAERVLRLERIAREAAVAGRLRLAEFVPGEAVVIGLFDPARPDLAARRFRENAEVRPLHRVLTVRAGDEPGRVEVMTDEWRGAVWSEALRTPLAAPASSGRLGVGEGPEPWLDRRAPLVLVLDGGARVAPPQLVGYVETLTGDVLLDG